MFGIQLLISLIYIQMIQIRSNVFMFKLEKTFCQISLFLFIITNLFSIKENFYMINGFFLTWLFIHILEVIIYHQAHISYILRVEFFNRIIRLYENFGIQSFINYLQQRIPMITLLRIFWLTKIIILPIGIRQIYTNPYVINTTIKSDDNTTISYDESFAKTVYFTFLYYGTETTFT